MLDKTLEFKNDLLTYGRASFDLCGSFDYTGYIPTYHFKADKTYKADNMGTIQDKSDWDNDTERWELTGVTDLGYQDGILKYVSTGEMTYTGKEPFSGKFILESTPRGKKGYYDLSYPHITSTQSKSSYYGESDVKKFGKVCGYTTKGKRRFVDPYESLDTNLLVNNKGILEYGNKVTTFFGVDFGKPNSDNWCISHTAKISGDEYS